MSADLNKYAILLVCFLVAAGKKNYDVIHNHLTISGQNKEILNFEKFSNSLYNRTTRSFSLNMRLFQEVNHTYQMYQFRSNQYHLFAPIRFDLSICNVLKANAFGISDLLRNTSNMAPVCPVPKGLYIFQHITYDGSMLPPNIPYGKYKLVLYFHSGKTPAVTASWYGELREPIRIK